MTGYRFKVINEILDEMRKVKQQEGRDMTREEYEEFVDKVFKKWKEKSNQ